MAARKSYKLRLYVPAKYFNGAFNEGKFIETEEITLKEVDEFTTKFETKKEASEEFIRTMCRENRNLFVCNINPEELITDFNNENFDIGTYFDLVKKVKTKNGEGWETYGPILLKKDEQVLNRDQIQYDWFILSHDKNFVEKVIKVYKKRFLNEDFIKRELSYTHINDDEKALIVKRVLTVANNEDNLSPELIKKILQKSINDENKTDFIAKRIVKKHKKTKGLNFLVSELEASVRNTENFPQVSLRFMESMIKGYTNDRNCYLFMKKYKEKKDVVIDAVVEDTHSDIMMMKKGNVPFLKELKKGVMEARKALKDDAEEYEQIAFPEYKKGLDFDNDDDEEIPIEYDWDKEYLQYLIDNGKQEEIINRYSLEKLTEIDYNHVDGTGRNDKTK